MIIHPVLNQGGKRIQAPTLSAPLVRKGYANGKRFSHFIFGSTCDYVKARAMVNGTDNAEKIAATARDFEAVLLKAAQR